MKVLIYIAALALLSAFTEGLTDEQKANAQEFYQECMVSTGVGPEAIRQVKEGKLTEDDKVNEFVFCFFKKAGFMNEGGELQTDVIKTKLSGDLTEAELKTVLDKCNTVTGKNLPEKAANIFKCYFETTPKHIALTI